MNKPTIVIYETNFDSAIILELRLVKLGYNCIILSNLDELRGYFDNDVKVNGMILGCSINRNAHIEILDLFSDNHFPIFSLASVGLMNNQKLPEWTEQYPVVNFHPYDIKGCLHNLSQTMPCTIPHAA